MEKLNDILQRHVASGDDTNNKLLGASFVVLNKDGESQDTAQMSVSTSKLIHIRTTPQIFYFPVQQAG